MWNGNIRKDSCTSGRETSGFNGGRSVGSVARNMSRFSRLIVLSVVLLASSGPVFGQFTVQPMRLELELTPGKRLLQVIDVQNIDPNETHTIDLTVVDLTQNENAAWQIIEPNSGFDTSKLASMKDTIDLNPKTVVLGPGQNAPVEVQIRVPRGVRGFACAGILASIRSRPGTEDVSFVLRFMVPIIVQTPRTIAHRVSAYDLGMEHVPAGRRGYGAPATTIVSMNIENTGGTFPRTRPVARVWSWSAGHWRTITTTGFQDISTDIGIIPGAKLKIETDLQRSLPPGKYKIAGVLYVDGRRTRRIEKIIDFEGDPTIQRVAADTPLDLRTGDTNSDEIIIQNMPGATRIATMQVYNGSDETVEVRTNLNFPRELASGVLGNIRGIDMDCTPWVTVWPEKFTLKGEGAMQNVRITAMMPPSALKCPNYYANVNFWAFYPDGQNAGLTTAKLCVQNANMKVESKIVATSMTPAVLSGSNYHISARFGNPGITHVAPLMCKATVTDQTSQIPRISAILTSEVNGYMLPWEQRVFAGVLDFSSLPAGDYRLTVGMQYSEDPDVPWAFKQAQIRVTIESGRRIVETTGTQEDLPEILDVKWSSAPSRAS